MGGSISTSEHIKYHSDRGGDYTVTVSNNKWTFRWGSIRHGIEVDIFKQHNIIVGHLVRNNSSKKTKKHFLAERDGHLDVLVEGECVEIQNILLRPRGICTKSVGKVMFAAMRIYAQEMKRPIRSGIVEISSDYAKAAYSCYKKAFKMNGFSTVMPKPPRPKVLHYIVIFTRDVFQTPKLHF